MPAARSKFIRSAINLKRTLMKNIKNLSGIGVMVTVLLSACGGQRW